MDRAPADVVLTAREAIAELDPPVEVRRLRLRQAAGRTFTDVVIGVSPGAAVGQGHAVADRVEEAVERALPGSDVVVHVEPAGAEAALSERVREAAMSVARVREIHNLSVIELDDGFHVTLHLKLPGDLALDEAHSIAEEVERAIVDGVPEVVDVQSHLEPLGKTAAGREEHDDPAVIERARSRRDRRRAARAPLPPHRRGPRRPAHARARPGRQPRRRARDRLEGGVADSRRRPRRDRGDRPHRAVTSPRPQQVE